MKTLPLKQLGFTLVEIAIVLIIIGLILGGIIKGQSLVGSAKAKDVIAIGEELRTATVYFKQRYNYLPGDLPAPAADITAVPALVAGTGGTVGNGYIEGAVNALGQATPTTSEVAVAPLQLYYAGFIGKINLTAPTQLITTSYGAVHLVTNANANANGLIATYGNAPLRNVILFTNLPCDIVNEVDAKIDDGTISGAIGVGGRAKGNACAANTVNFYAVGL